MKNFKHPNNQGLVSHFDFADKANPDNALTTIESIAEQKKSEIKGKIFNNKYRQNNNASIILVMVICALAALCGFTTYQIYRFENGENNHLLNGQTSPQATAKNDQKPDSKNISSQKEKARNVIWSGEGFSLASKITPVPQGFTREIVQAKSDFFDNQEVELNSFIANDNISGDEFQSGILVYRMEYDNKLDQQKFTQKILEKYNTDYISSGEQTHLAGDFTSTKIVPINKKNFTAIYPVVSTNNYYVVKVLTQGKEERSLDQKTKFVEDMISNLTLK